MIVGKQKLSHEKEREREPWKIIKESEQFAFPMLYIRKTNALEYSKREINDERLIP